METIIHTTPDVFEQLRPEWNALLRNSAADTPFLTYEWQKTWSDCLCSCEGELHLLTVRDGGALLGIAPLFVLSEPDKDGKPWRLLRLIGSVDASDYLDLIAVRGREREVLNTMLDALEQLDTWDAIDLWNVPEASVTRALLPELIAARGWTVLEHPSHHRGLNVDGVHVGAGGELGEPAREHAGTGADLHDTCWILDTGGVPNHPGIEVRKPRRVVQALEFAHIEFLVRHGRTSVARLALATIPHGV